jgi:hypothetical protein
MGAFALAATLKALADPNVTARESSFAAAE